MSRCGSSSSLLSSSIDLKTRAGSGQGSILLSSLRLWSFLLTLALSPSTFSFGLHSLDRMARLCRILYYHWFKPTVETEDSPLGTVRILSHDAMRVTVRTRQRTSLLYSSDAPP
jgi:hypothetical protein